MKKTKTALFMIVGFAIAISLVSCGGKKDAASSASGKKVMSLTFGGGTPLYMDPALNSASVGNLHGAPQWAVAASYFAARLSDESRYPPDFS